MPVQCEQDGKEKLAPEMERHKTQIAIGDGKHQRRFPVIVEIGKQRIARQVIHGQHPGTAEDQKADHPGDTAGCKARQLVFPASSQRHQGCGEAHAEGHFRQFQTHGHAGDKSRHARDRRRLVQRPARQRIALLHQDGQPAQHKHAHHIVVIGGAEFRQGQRADQPQHRQRPRHDLDVGGLRIHPQRAARHQIQRHDIGALRRTQHAQRNPGSGVGRQPVEGNIEIGIVVAGLVRHGHVDAEAVVQQGIGRIPMIVAEIPAGVLAQQDDKGRPEQDAKAQECIFAGCKAGRRWHQGGGNRGHARPF